MGVRVEKLQEQIKEEVSQIILRGLKDPRIGFVTITEVKLSSDLRNAHIFVSILGSKSEFKDTWEGLRHSTGYIRQELAKRIRVKFAPEIEFFPDTTAQYSEHIQKLINQIHAKKELNDD